jgi:hypothetical protein
VSHHDQFQAVLETNHIQGFVSHSVSPSDDET